MVSLKIVTKQNIPQIYSKQDLKIQEKPNSIFSKITRPRWKKGLIFTIWALLALQDLIFSWKMKWMRGGCTSCIRKHNSTTSISGSQMTSSLVAHNPPSKTASSLVHVVYCKSINPCGDLCSVYLHFSAGFALLLVLGRGACGGVIWSFCLACCAWRAMWSFWDWLLSRSDKI